MNTAPANKMLTYYFTIPSDKQDFHAKRLEPKCWSSSEQRHLGYRLFMNLLIKFSWWYFIGILGVSRTDGSDAAGK